MEELERRPIQEEDLDFLRLLYHSTRSDEMKMIPHWSEEEKKKFLDSQFFAQHQFYQKNFPKAKFEILSFDGQRAGRLYQEQREDEIRIIDIALLPEFRNRGIGSKILSSILAHGRMHNLPIRIHVEEFNPALNLYHRLGFEKIGVNGVYFLMEYKPK